MDPEVDQIGDCPDDLESVEDEEGTNEISHKLLKFPNLVASLNAQNQQPPIYNSLPPMVKRRVKALKKLQRESTDIEAKFFAEVHALECKYSHLFQPIYEKRSAIVNAKHEPTDEEAYWVSDDEEELAKELNEKAKIEEKKEADPPKETELIKGVPDFWLTILKNVTLLAEMVQDHDEPILKYLTDIKVKFVEDPMGFVLEFYFSPNEYFSNTMLTKEYDMKCMPDEDEPFTFDGPEIYRCRGCTINWQKGKNVTLKTFKKKQKHKSRGLVRTITKTVQNDSFFNFFSPTSIPEDINGTEVDEETRTLLTSDFEIGHYIRERIVPRAVLYFTGEGIEDEEDYDEEEDDEEEEEEEDSDGKECLHNGKPTDQNCKQQ